VCVGTLHGGPLNAMGESEQGLHNGDGTPSPREATWRLVCEHPPLYLCSDFMEPWECEAIVRLARESAPSSLNRYWGNSSKLRVDLNPSDTDLGEDMNVLRSVEKRVAALSGLQPHGAELPWAVHCTPPLTRDESERDCPVETRMNLGLHVDTNNCRDRRWLTFIAYLRTTPPEIGGHTVFPLALRRGAVEPKAAKARRLRSAAEVLLGSNVHHTGQANNTYLGEQVKQASQLLLAQSDVVARLAAGQDSTKTLEDICWHPSGMGLAVAPVQGRCVAFLTRSLASDGAIDPRSWHAGAAVVPNDEDSADVGKWTLQKFREVPLDPTNACSVKDFAIQHSTLLPGCSGGVRFDVEESTSEAS